MSRRPRAVAEQVLMNRLRYMAPGGRLASESPVRRAPGTLRPPRVGGGGSSSVVPPDFVVFNRKTCAFNSTSWTILNGAVYSAGDVAVTLIAGVRTTLGLPSGWTGIGSGTVDGLSWISGYRVLTGSDDFMASSSVPWSNTLLYDGYGVAQTWFWGPTSAVPSVASSASDAATSLAMLASGNGWNSWVGKRHVETSSSLNPSTGGLSGASVNSQPDYIASGYGYESVSPYRPAPLSGSLSSGAVDACWHALAWDWV